MKKSIVATVVAVTAIAASTMMGCGVSFSSTVTKSETVTDADGNTTTTTTTTVKDSNGRRSETQTTSYEADSDDEYTVATLSFENNSGIDFAEMYLAQPEAENWGNEILGEDAPLVDGEIITFNDRFSYNEDCSFWDLCVVDEDGESIEFDGLNVSEADDAEDIVIVITYDAEADAFTACVN